MLGQKCCTVTCYFIPERKKTNTNRTNNGDQDFVVKKTLKTRMCKEIYTRSISRPRIKLFWFKVLFVTQLTSIVNMTESSDVIKIGKCLVLIVNYHLY